jgi:5-methylcytosine-specific restriction endonuclease McrA
MSSRDPVEIDKRRSVSPARRKRILDRYDHQCAYPGCTETKGLEIDHIVCLALGGKDDERQMEPLCGPHHLQKTRRDVKMIAKAKRIIKREDGTRRPRKPIPGRGFDKTLRKRFNGKVEKRK